MIGLEQAERALKSVYLDIISTQLNTANGFIASVKKTTQDVWGKEIITSTPLGNGGYLQITQEITNLYGDIEITDKALKVIQQSTGAFVDLLNSEIENLLKETKNKIINATYSEDKKPNYLPEKYEYKPLQLSGLKELFNTNQKTLYGVDRKKYNFNPIIEKISNVNTFKIEHVIDEINPDINFLICNPDTKRKIKEFLSAHHQNIVMRETPSGYYGMQLNNNVIIETHKDIPNNEIWLVNSNDFKFHQLCDWLWLEDDEGKILRKDNTKPVYRARLVKYGNLMCHNVNKQIKIILEEKNEI